MDKSWMFIRDRRSEEFQAGVASFLEVARNCPADRKDEARHVRCPCQRCGNRYFFPLGAVEMHLYKSGIMPSYMTWTSHGEAVPPIQFPRNIHEQNLHQPSGVNEEEDEEYEDVMAPLFEDLINPTAQGSEKEDEGEGEKEPTNSFFDESSQKLYEGCNLSALEFVVRLMHTKVLNRWSNKSFDMLLNIFHMFWPDMKTIPESTYDAKKRLRDLGLGYETIHACKYDCALFWKHNEGAERCPVCQEPRYKSNDGKGKMIPHKSLRYFPVKPRLQRLFMSRHTARDMRWHKEKRVDDDALRHPADGEAWKHLDETYPQFSTDARNVRLGLASDGFNPFGNMSLSYSMWPVILVSYNLPPWKLMKEPFRMMSLLIPGPQSPRREIDVYLRPLIDEMKELWVGVETYDAASGQNFLLHAAIMWTINDFPAYGNLSGWSTHGYKACPICLDDTSSMGITSKICYMFHRRYLPETHTWQKSRLHDGRHEMRAAPQIKSGDEILMRLEHVKNIMLGKNPNNKDHKRKRTPLESNWTKKSIFFELPYWSKLKIRHVLDVMHIEKNICDNVLYTVLNIEGRTKDTVKARQDLKNLKIRKELWIKEDGGRMVKPHASFALTSMERKEFLEWISHVRFPDGYAANISKGVNIQGGKITGLKSHDCHVMLQRLLPIAIRPYLQKDVCTTLVELSNFFQQLTAKKLIKSDLEKLEEGIVMILCKLERIFHLHSLM